MDNTVKDPKLEAIVNLLKYKSLTTREQNESHGTVLSYYLLGYADAMDDVVRIIKGPGVE